MANRNPTLTSALILILAIPGLASLAQPGQAVKDTLKGEIASPAQLSDERASPDSLPNPPNVVCSGNQLTISTNNSTLGSVLNDVQKCIGMKIDMPEGAASSRVFDKLGPGPAREVIAALLSSTGFDFLIGSSESDPGKIDSVLLIARTTDKSAVAPPDATLTPARRAYLLMQKDLSRTSTPPAEETGRTENAQPDTPTKEDTAGTQADNGGAKADQTPPSDQPPTPVDMNPAPLVNQGSAQPNTSTPSAQSTGTQDQITNMEKLFQQRRQMNQNQQSQSPQ